MKSNKFWALILGLFTVAGVYVACLAGSPGFTMPASGGGTPSGSAGGDLTGTYPNPTVKTSVALTTPSLSAPAITGAMTGTGAYIPTSLLNSGTSASSSTFWRGDGTWASASGGNAVYGDGSDGGIAFNGVANPVAGATLSGSTYTLTRDVYASSISISTGVTIELNAGAYRIFCTGATTFTGTATISNTGKVGAATGAGGGAGTDGTIGADAAGGGASSTTTGSNGGNITNAEGGAGGNGGSGSSGSGGTGGTVTNPTAANGGTGIPRAVPYCLNGRILAGNGLLRGGGGGAGGGGDGASGAGGGGAGGVVLIASQTFIASGTSGTQITATGGAGGSASLGTNTGGGGGGGGGLIIITTSTALPAGISAAAAGGAKGNKKAGGTGNDGVAGSSGTVYTIIN